MLRDRCENRACERDFGVDVESTAKWIVLQYISEPFPFRKHDDIIRTRSYLIPTAISLNRFYGRTRQIPIKGENPKKFHENWLFFK